MSDDSLYQAISDAVKERVKQIHTALPAKVISFNGHAATIELMIKKLLVGGKEIEVPPLVDVPVQFPHAGGFCFTVPVTAGDEGLAIFSERCIDGWYSSGDKSKPLDNRFHDYSDASFIIGINSKPNKIKNFFSNGASMQTDDGSTYIRLTNGKILIKGDIEHQGDNKQTGNHDLTGNLDVGKNATVEGNSTTTGNITSLSAVISTAGVVAGGGISAPNGGPIEAKGTLKADEMEAKGIKLSQHTHPTSKEGTPTGKPT